MTYRSLVGNSKVDFMALNDFELGDKLLIHFKSDSYAGAVELLSMVEKQMITSRNTKSLALALARGRWGSPRNQFVEVKAIHTFNKTRFSRSLAQYIDLLEITHRERPLVDLGQIHVPDADLRYRFKPNGFVGVHPPLLLAEAGAVEIKDATHLLDAYLSGRMTPRARIGQLSIHLAGDYNARYREEFYRRVVRHLKYMRS